MMHLMQNHGLLSLALLSFAHDLSALIMWLVAQSLLCSSRVFSFPLFLEAFFVSFILYLARDMYNRVAAEGFTHALNSALQIVVIPMRNGTNQNMLDHSTCLHCVIPHAKLLIYILLFFYYCIQGDGLEHNERQISGEMLASREQNFSFSFLRNVSRSAPCFMNVLMHCFVFFLLVYKLVPIYIYINL